MTIFIMFWGLGNSSQTWARMDRVPGSRYTSSRAAALGDAFLPLADDGISGLFYNPAALALQQMPRADIMNLALTFSPDLFGTYSYNAYKATSLSSISSLLQSNPNVPARLAGAFAPAFTFKGFALGLLVDMDMFSVYENGQIRYRTKAEVTPAAGFGFGLANNIVRIGYSIQWINLSSGEQTVAPSAASSYFDGLSQGSGLSHNVGAALTFPVNPLPAFNLVARNLAGVQYTSSSLVKFAKNSPGVPADEKMSFDASFSIQPSLGRGSIMNLVAEMRDLSNASQTNILVRMAAGMEIAFRKVFHVRAGYRGGYPSLGLGIVKPHSEFSLSWYSEELGTGFRENRDMSIVFQYRVGAF